MVAVEFVIQGDGTVVGIYSDKLPYRAMAAALGGDLAITRASHVEPTLDGRWVADLSPSGGPLLGPFDLRQTALDQEIVWLRTNVLGTIDCPSGRHDWSASMKAGIGIGSVWERCQSCPAYRYRRTAGEPWTVDAGAAS